MEAVAKANNSNYGLACGVWSEKGSRTLWVAQRLRAGDDADLARAHVLQPTAPDRRGQAQEDEEQREHPAKRGDLPVALGREQLAEEADVNLMLECHPMTPIDADPDLLFEALSNLVDNAIKFTPAGGSVWIRAGSVEGVVHIDIIDTGCGVPLTERAAVMLRFHRSQAAQPNLAAQPPREGFGLGLSIAAAVMRLHGFALRFQDTEQGTHLTIVCSGQIL